MQLELFDDLETELDKALRDEKHTLAKSIRDMSEAMRLYQDECEKAFKVHDEVYEHAKVLERSNMDMLNFIKDFYLILNAEKEKASQIKGMDEILKAMSHLILSPASIQMGVLNNKGN